MQVRPQKGKTLFGETHTIIGDQRCVKNGFKYHVWGASTDPNTWFEQNSTIENAFLRKLRRKEVEVPDKDQDKGIRAKHDDQENFVSDSKEEGKSTEQQDEHHQENVKFVA